MPRCCLVRFRSLGLRCHRPRYLTGASFRIGIRWLPRSSQSGSAFTQPPRRRIRPAASHSFIVRFAPTGDPCCGHRHRWRPAAQSTHQRLDTRTVLATATLSKRWAGLPRCLDALDFRVSDILPARYHQSIRIRVEAARYTYGFDVNLKVLRATIERYERRAMRAMASSINNFLDADDDQDRGGLGPRVVRTLRLEFFANATHCSSSINRLIAMAVDSWGVEDLEVSAKSTFRRKDAHSFPHHGLCNNPHKSRLRSLKLAACYIPPLKGFHALTSLVLQDLPESTPTTAYEAIFTLCPQLQALHLKSCSFNLGVVAVHAPKSEIKQLIVEDCWFGLIKLYTLPMLESMAVVQGSHVSLYKNGHVQDRGCWDWDMVTQEYQWVNEEKVKILDQIVDSVPCAATPIQVVLQ
ncbi:hypothetical protein C2845_PM16G09160 [Panicum miliaceum]|uniref:At1g61320/AtMIF1 LRR domain-containing protein n=1 Tax=Panicum miliaceum TaxID=4540 RepID=A0A3L6PU02_PANMI|nr:hypothetical protein C2845_PM16G09160 [Panicum miliaceum]